MTRRACTISIVGLLLLAPWAARGAEIGPELDRMAEELARQLVAADRRNVGVLDFTDASGRSNRLGRKISESLTTKLVTKRGTGTYKVLERQHLQKLMQERQLVESRLVAEGDGKVFQQVTGLDTIVTGSIDGMGEHVDVVAKALSVDGFEIVAAVEGRISRTADVTALLSEALDTSATVSRTDSAAPAAPPVAETGGRGSADKAPPNSSNGVFSISLQSITRSQSQARDHSWEPITVALVSVVLSLENTSGKDVTIAHDRDQSVRLSGNGTSSWELVSVSGMGEIRGIDYFAPTTLFPAGAKQSITWTFQGDAKDAATEFAISASVACRIEGKTSHLPVSLTGMRLAH